MDNLKACGLKQHVHEPTHIHGHTLDVVISRDTSDVVSDVTVTDPVLCDHLGAASRDHFAVSFTTYLPKPAPIQKTVSYRKLRQIKVEVFRQDIINSPQLCHTSGSVDNLVCAYDEGLSSLLDKHVPICTKTIMLRPNCPWYSDDLHKCKHVRRQLERKWRKTRLTFDHQIYQDYCTKINKLIKQAKVSYYSEKIIACGRDQRGIFNMAKHLLGDSKGPCLPENYPAGDVFSCFTDKISKIRNDLQVNSRPLNAGHSVDILSGTASLEQFKPASAEVKSLIMKSPTKLCRLDPIPTWLLKSCVDDLLPLITSIINVSLSRSHVPGHFQVCSDYTTSEETRTWSKYPSQL